MTVFHPRVRSASSQMAGAAANVAAVRAVARTCSRTSRSLACLARSAYRARQDRFKEWLAVLDGPGNRRLGVAELLFGRSSELATITPSTIERMSRTFCGVTPLPTRVGRWDASLMSRI